MPELAFIGYELRERVVSEVARPLPDYPLGFETCTMDSALCRPCRDSAWRANGYSVFLHPSIAEVRSAYRAITSWVPYAVGTPAEARDEGDFRIFGYYLEAAVIPRFIEFCREVVGDAVALFRSGSMETQQRYPFAFMGYDVVRGLSQFDRWESDVANEGIPRDELERYGVLNGNGLFQDYRGAFEFKRELASYHMDECDPPVVAAVHSAALSGLR